MATIGKRWSKARARCPSPEHAGSRVRFDGHYGEPGHRRQLYRCVPANGDRAHRFTELLHREEAWRDACETCERPVHLHEGPHAARRYQFVARGIAEALQAVGAGQTYRQAGLVARERARRLRADPETGERRMTRHGQLVADWVEVFAPVVFEPHRPLAWPVRARFCSTTYPSRCETRSPLAFGSRSGSSARPASSAGGPSSGASRRFPTLLRPAGRRSCAPWRGLHRAWSATTTMASNGAVRAVFPEAELDLCEWHLRHALERLMAKIRKSDEHRAATDALLPRVEAAFTGPSFWKPFARDARAADIPGSELARWRRAPQEPRAH